MFDLFPPAMLEEVPPPNAAVGTTIGPQPRADSPRHQRTPVPPPVDAFPCFHSAEHDRVVAWLLDVMRPRERDQGSQAVASEASLSLLIGEHGIGKSIACRAALRQLDRRTAFSFVTEHVDTADDLLRTLLVDFGVLTRDAAAGEANTRESLVSALHSFLSSLAVLQATAVIVVDAAHRQSIDVLSELVELARDAAGALQVVLVGPPALAARLRERYELRAADRAIGARIEHGPLMSNEIPGYVTFRLSEVGVSGRMHVDASACARLFLLSRGIPAVLNELCDRALELAGSRSRETIDAPLVDAVVTTLEEAMTPPDDWPIVPPALAGILLAALMLLGGAGAMWVFRDAVARTVAQWEHVAPRN